MDEGLAFFVAGSAGAVLEACGGQGLGASSRKLLNWHLLIELLLFVTGLCDGILCALIALVDGTVHYPYFDQVQVLRPA